METAAAKPWIGKLNILNSKILMPAMALSFILFNTVINLWIGERIETLQNLLAICVLAIWACNILSEPKRLLKPWIKSNVIVIIYFIARLISLWQSGFDYSVIRTVFFEIFFLVGICKTTLQDEKSIYIKIFIWLELIISGLSLLLFYMYDHLGAASQQFLLENTYLEKTANAMLFSNPNTAGLMAGFSIVLAVILYGKKNYNKYFMAGFGIYNIAALILFGCRSADVGVVAVVLIFLLCSFWKKVQRRKIIAAVLALSVLTLIPIYGIVAHSIKTQDMFSNTAFEEKIDSLSTGRYTIWKECVIAQQDNKLFGAGNLNLEQKARQQLVSEVDQTYYARYVSAAQLGPHNGYIGMISATGWAGFGLFIAILLQRIKRAKHLEKGRWHLMLIFIFVINCFESLFILNRFFTCFYMFLILETDMEDGEKRLTEAR
ncbi:MAG: O-antigen ligase family protein [Firmicutes bacterium]|nr:O-antigen ligase family protein [Bacillota bacterium]